MNLSTTDVSAVDDDRIHFVIISTSIFVVSFFGLIGNFHVIMAILRFPELRTKNGVLLCFLACHHCVCLAFETLSAVRMQLDHRSRRACYSSIFVYTYTINHQCCLVLVLVCDIAFCMVRPLKYHQIPVYPYVHLMQIPCYLFGFSFLVIGFVTMNDETVLACNPPLAYSFSIMSAWNICYLFANAATVIIYSSALLYTVCCGGPLKGTNNTIQMQQKRIVRSLSALLVIFCFSWFLGAVAVRGPMVLEMNPKFIAFVQTYAVIPAILSYSQTYYIYFVVSRDYRDAFRRIGLFGMLMKKTERGFVSRVTATSNRSTSRT